MDTNASLGRFYAFTPNHSATLPSSASSPDPQYRRHRSGSDSASEGDGSPVHGSQPSERGNPNYDGLRVPYGSQNPPSFPQNRGDPTAATFYEDDSPYIPPSSNRPSQTATFIETAPDVPFTSSVQTYHAGFPSLMTSTTLPPTTARRNSGQTSPTGSHGSGRSDHSHGQTGSSNGSASSGVVSNGSPPQEFLQQEHDVFHSHQRVGPPPGYNPQHYPAYDQNFRRVGMEHARFGTDPPQAVNAYYRPRTHTYPPVGAHGMPLGMGSSGALHMSHFAPSPDMQLVPMHPDDIPFDRDMRHDHLIPGQTRIHLPSAAPPQSYEGYDYDDPSTSHLRSGDDSYMLASDADVRRILGLSPDQELSLNALSDPPPGQRPGQSIPTLSQLAILGSPQKRLTLQEIYLALEDRFEWFRMNVHDKSWQNSIRHNLSLYKCFKRIPKPITEPGKGSYWTVDYSEGLGTKRPRRRAPRGKKKAEREAAEREQQENQATQEVMEDGDSSQDEEDEEYTSPTQSLQDIPIDPVLTQGHQVGQGRLRSSARSIARRGSSPYAQAATPPTANSARRQNSSPSYTNLSHAGSRNPSAVFGQPSFGQPSLGPPSMGSLLFGQPTTGGRSSSADWHPGMVAQGTGPSQNYLPPPRPRPIGGAAGAVPTDGSAHATHLRATPVRSHTMPTMSNNAPFNTLPPLPGIDQLRDASGRFVARGTYATGHFAGSQSYFQDYPRGMGGRNTSSSSASSPLE